MPQSESDANTNTVEGVTMTRYNKSEMMRNVHNRRRKYGQTMSKTLRGAWAQAAVNSQIGKLAVSLSETCI